MRARARRRYVLQADLSNGARLLGWQGEIGAIKPGYYADIIAVRGNPLEDIAVLQHVVFVMKNGMVWRASPDGPALPAG
jgi:imidazolonepropionase-like amidohydrolase